VNDSTSCECAFLLNASGIKPNGEVHTDAGEVRRARWVMEALFYLFIYEYIVCNVGLQMSLQPKGRSTRRGGRHLYVGGPKMVLKETEAQCESIIKHLKKN
jgi:hypothetical protein